MLKIRRSEDNGLAVFGLSGRFEREQVSELQKLLEAEAELRKVTLDLDELRLVDREAVRFLAACEAGGIKLENCPSYVREWIETGRETGYEL
jgi:hypothetical protein